jgi:hypothetical protein
MTRTDESSTCGVSDMEEVEDDEEGEGEEDGVCVFSSCY